MGIYYNEAFLEGGNSNNKDEDRFHTRRLPKGTELSFRTGNGETVTHKDNFNRNERKALQRDSDRNKAKEIRRGLDDGSDVQHRTLSKSASRKLDRANESVSIFDNIVFD